MFALLRQIRCPSDLRIYSCEHRTTHKACVTHHHVETAVELLEFGFIGYRSAFGNKYPFSSAQHGARSEQNAHNLIHPSCLSSLVHPTFLALAVDPIVAHRPYKESPAAPVEYLRIASVLGDDASLYRLAVLRHSTRSISSAMVSALSLVFSKGGSEAWIGWAVPVNIRRSRFSAHLETRVLARLGQK